jgi:hypothetical protein
MGRSFFKSNLPSSTRLNPLEAFVFDGGQGPVTFINSIAGVTGRAFIERVATEAEADFEMYAFFFLCFSFSHFVRSDWIMYFFTFMVGAAHYGLPVGRRFDKGGLDAVSAEIVPQRTLTNWIYYCLPQPLTFESKKILHQSYIVAYAAIGEEMSLDQAKQAVWNLGPEKKKAINVRVAVMKYICL